MVLFSKALAAKRKNSILFFSFTFYTYLSFAINDLHINCTQNINF